MSAFDKDAAHIYIAAMESGNVKGLQSLDFLRAALDRIDELIAEVEDWRDDAKNAAEERHNDDSVHCTCVGPLRHRVRELEARYESLDAITLQADETTAAALKAKDDRVDELEAALRRVTGLLERDLSKSPIATWVAGIARRSLEGSS